MKVSHTINPALHIKDKSGDIRTYGSIQVNLLFMLKPEGLADPDDFVLLVQRMMKAACDTIDTHNKEHNLCLGQSENPNEADGI